MIYDNVIALLAQKNMSIHALEVKAGIGNGAIAKWKDSERGPSINTVKAVADALGVTVNDLLKRAEP